MAKRKPKKIKKKKLESKPRIRRRLYKLCLEIAKIRAGYRCEICDQPLGYMHNGKPQRLETHHGFSRNVKNSPLKFALDNLFCLCTLCHKTGETSAHKNGLIFAMNVQVKYPDRYYFIVNHWQDRVDLEDREVLYAIERDLKEQEIKWKSIHWADTQANPTNTITQETANQTDTIG